MDLHHILRQAGVLTKLEDVPSRCLRAAEFARLQGTRLNCLNHRCSCSTRTDTQTDREKGKATVNCGSLNRALFFMPIIGGEKKEGVTVRRSMGGSGLVM